MAEGNRPRKSNLAEAAFRKNYTALYDALAQPLVTTGLAIKLYGGVIITPETRDAILTPGIPPAQQACFLLQAVEASIKIDHTRLRKFTRVLKKQPVLEPIAKQLRQCYSALVSEARLTESSNSESDTDSTEQHQSQGALVSEARLTESSSAGSDKDSTEQHQCQDSRTERRIEVLEEKYLALVQKTQQDVMKQKPALEKFLTEITLLPTSFKEEHIKLYIKDNLPQLYHAESIPEIFGLLNLHWNYLHYGLLQRIIKIYGADDTRELMKSYVDDVNIFQEETTLAMFWRVGSKRMRDVPKSLKEKLAEVLTSHKELTPSSSLKSIEKLRQEFAQNISLPEFAIVMKDVLPGSVIISWLMPPKGAITLMNQVKEGTVEFFKQHHILELRMDDVIIYPSAPMPPAHLPSTTTELNLQAMPSENEAKSAPPILPHVSKPGQHPGTSPKDTDVPLTIDNITRELEGVDCMERSGLGWRLRVPDHKLVEIEMQHSTRTNQTRATLEYWLSVDPTPSWRRLVWALEGNKEHQAADRVRPYVEPLTDPSLTAENVSSVLQTLRASRAVCNVLGVPLSRWSLIEGEHSTEPQRRQAAVDWWLRYHPSAAWTQLAGRLYCYEEMTALKAVLPHIAKETADSTLTTTNLWQALAAVREWWGFSPAGLRHYLQVPDFVEDEIRQQTSDATQQKKTLLERWLRDHPAPSWAVVAEALYKRQEHGVLEQVKKTYITGSQWLFEEAMRHGSVQSRITKVLVTGTAGSGKTCSKHVIIDEPPPPVRKSTPCAERPIRVATIGVRGMKWVRIGSKRLINYLAAAMKARAALRARKLKAAHERSSQEPHPQSDDDPQLGVESVSTDETEISSTQESGRESGATCMGEVDSSAPPEKASFESLLEAAVTEEELVRLIEQTTSSDVLHEIAWVQFVDSGGQPQFLEVLPIFLRRTSVWIYVLKLSERLDDYPTVEYYDENGSRIGRPYAAAYTNKQIFQQFLQTIKSHKATGGKSPKILVVGTHRDKQSECTESMEEKNQILSELLKPFANDIVYSNFAKREVIFPLNAQSPDKDDRGVAEQIRALIMRHCSPQPDEIPLGWYALQLKLREIAEALGREVISREECLAVAEKLHLDEKSLDAALQFLDSLNTIFYYKDILPKAIFCDTQVLLDKATELVEFSYKLRDGSKCEGVAREGEWKNFSEYGLVSSSFLDTFEKHYVPGVFTSQELIKLFRTLFILADFPKPGYYFMPCLLQRLSPTEVAEHRACATSFVTHFPHGARHGMFCALIAFLLSPENRFPNAWNVVLNKLTNAPLCLYRNCVKFALPQFPGQVTLIDSVDFFEVHVDACSEVVASLRQHVHDAVLVGLEKAAETLHYTNSKPEIAFPCPCSRGDFHIATVNLEQSWWLCTTDQKGFGHLEEKHTAWLPAKAAVPSTAAEAMKVVGDSEAVTLKRKADEQLAVSEPQAKKARVEALSGDDLVDIMGYLHTLDKNQLTNLGLVLGLSPYRVTELMDKAFFLGNVVLLWLSQADQVATRSGVPTWRSLVKALRHELLGQNGIASWITTEKNLE